MLALCCKDKTLLSMGGVAKASKDFSFSWVFFSPQSKWKSGISTELSSSSHWTSIEWFLVFGGVAGDSVMIPTFLCCCSRRNGDKVQGKWGRKWSVSFSFLRLGEHTRTP